MQEAIGAVEDILTKIVPTMFLPEEEKKAQRKALAEGPIPLSDPATTKARSALRSLC